VEVRIDQRLDAANSPEVERRLSGAIAEGARHLRLDLAEVSFISSAGLRVLAAAYKQLQELGGTLQIVAVHPNAERVIELAGFGALLMTPETSGNQEPSEIYETEHARVEWFDLPGKGYQVQPLTEATWRLTSRQEGCPIAFGTGTLSSGGDEGAAQGAFLALDRTVFHQSADQPAPDYLQVSGLLEPEVEGASGFSLEGTPQAQMRIAPRDGAPVSLGELLEVALSRRHHGSAAVVGTLRVSGVEIPALRLTARDGSTLPHLIPAEVLGARHGLQLVICGVATGREAGAEALEGLPAWHWDEWTFHGIGLLAHDIPMPDGLFDPAGMVERVAQTSLLALAHLAGQAGEGLGLRLERGVLWSGSF